jgi:hypothetical protein
MGTPRQTEELSQAKSGHVAGFGLGRTKVDLQIGPRKQQSRDASGDLDINRFGRLGDHSPGPRCPCCNGLLAGHTGTVSMLRITDEKRFSKDQTLLGTRVIVRR